MLVGALDFLQRDVPEILVDRFPEQEPQAGHGASHGEQKTFPVERVDSPWTLRSTLQDIFRSSRPRLQPVAAKDVARHLVEIEMTATMAWLYTLIRHSVLLDVEATRTCRTTPRASSAGLGHCHRDGPQGAHPSQEAHAAPRPCAPACGPKTTSFASQRVHHHMTLQEAVDSAARRGGCTSGRLHRAGQRAGGQEVHHCPRLHPPAPSTRRRAWLTVPGVGWAARCQRLLLPRDQLSANTESDSTGLLAMFEREKV